MDWQELKAERGGAAQNETAKKQRCGGSASIVEPKFNLCNDNHDRDVRSFF
jgi:hypothetical protein